MSKRKLRPNLTEEQVVKYVNDVLASTKEKTIKDLTKIYSRICDIEIDHFYDDYNRLYYNPKNNLYNSYKVYFKNNKVLVEFSGDFMNDNYKNTTPDYIYDLTMKQGYHGGAFSDDSPNPSFPYWRTPYPEFTSWGRKAEKSDPPFEKIQEKIKNVDVSEVYIKNLDFFSKKFEKEVLNG